MYEEPRWSEIKSDTFEQAVEIGRSKPLPFFPLSHVLLNLAVRRRVRRHFLAGVFLARKAVTFMSRNVHEWA